MKELRYQTKLSPSYYLVDFYVKPENGRTRVLETVEVKRVYIPKLWAINHSVSLSRKLRQSVYFIIEKF